MLWGGGRRESDEQNRKIPHLLNLGKTRMSVYYRITQ